MGFWYFSLLFIGIFLIVRALIKRTKPIFKKLSILIIGICMVAFSLFMFQDGSAEIIDELLKSLHINL